MRINAYTLVSILLYILAYICGQEVTIYHEKIGADVWGNYHQSNPILALLAMVFAIVGLCKSRKKS
jgi:hypothetical protein